MNPVTVSEGQHITSSSFRSVAYGDDRCTGHYTHERFVCRGAFWSLLTYLQGGVLIAAWLMVLVEVSGWGNWYTPYKTLWFIVHLLERLFHNRVDTLRNTDRASKNHIMKEDYQAIYWLGFVTFCVDAATLIICAANVRPGIYVTTAAKTQLAFAAYVLFVTMTRNLVHLRTKEREWNCETSGKAQSTKKRG
jgi:hypothetical protein